MNGLLVFLGGGAGALCRYAVARWVPVPDLVNGGFPWATFLANFLACLVLAVGLGLVAREQLSKPMQLMLLTGFCGGFSTFSTFSAEVVALVEAGFSGQALLYAVGSTVVTGAVIFGLLIWLRG